VRLVVDGITYFIRKLFCPYECIFLGISKRIKRGDVDFSNDFTFKRRIALSFGHGDFLGDLLFGHRLKNELVQKSGKFSFLGILLDVLVHLRLIFTFRFVLRNDHFTAAKQQQAGQKFGFKNHSKKPADCLFI
jgi:hypothetical protein